MEVIEAAEVEDEEAVEVEEETRRTIKANKGIGVIIDNSTKMATVLKRKTETMLNVTKILVPEYLRRKLLCLLATLDLVIAVRKCEFITSSRLLYRHTLRLTIVRSNPGVKTIESEVFDACIKAGAISEDNSDNVNKVIKEYYVSTYIQ